MLVLISNERTNKRANERTSIMSNARGKAKAKARPLSSSSLSSSTPLSLSSRTTMVGAATGGSAAISVWSDLPRRLGTIVMGVPLIVLILSRPWSYHVFFLGVHLLCCMEWMSMTNTKTTNTKTTNTRKKDDATAATVTATATATADPTTTSWNTNRIMIMIINHHHAILFALMSVMIAHAPSSESTIFLLVLSVCVLFLMEFSTLTNEPTITTTAITTTATAVSTTTTTTNTTKEAMKVGTTTTGAAATTTTTTDITNTTPSSSSSSFQTMIITKPPPSFHSSLGLLLISLPLAAFYRSNFQDTCSILLIVWNCDTGALIVGRLCKTMREKRRRRRQGNTNNNTNNNNNGIPPPIWLQRISPAKSVEGMIGGFLVGVCTTICIPFLWNHVNALSSSSSSSSLHQDHQQDQEQQQNYHHHDHHHHQQQFTFALGCSLSLGALLGDLVESAVKRCMHQKDSSRLLPGHGGILDRFDSSFLAILCYDVWMTHHHHHHNS